MKNGSEKYLNLPGRRKYNKTNYLDVSVNDGS